jgi:hypothetical protein
MRKVYCFLCLLALAGCSKKSEVAPVVTPKTNALITYSFKSSAFGVDSIYYRNPSTLKLAVARITDTAWSVTDTVKDVESYAKQTYTFELGIGTILTTPGSNYTLSISINNQLVSKEDFNKYVVGSYVEYEYQTWRPRPL